MAAALPDTVFPYRREGEHVLIEIALDSLRQLFNSLDPAPFHAKDLDDDAEEFIFGAVRELPADAKLKLVVWLPADEANSEPARQLPQTVQNYFTYGAQMARRDLRLQLREARLIVLASLVFLGLCLLAREGLDSVKTGWAEWLSEGILILGWVAMWRPLEAVLYDWWAPLRRWRILQRLARMPVEVRAGTSPTAVTPE
jgi:hypothetical protein